MERYSRNMMDLAHRDKLCDGWDHVHQPIYHGYVLTSHNDEDIIAELAYTITQASTATTTPGDGVGHMQFLTVSPKNSTLSTNTIRYNNTDSIKLEDIKNTKAEIIPSIQCAWDSAVSQIHQKYTSLISFCQSRDEEGQRTITKEEKEEKRNKVVSVLCEHGWVYSYCTDNGDVYVKDSKNELIVGNTNLISIDTKFDFIRDYDSNKLLEFIESI